MHAVNGGRFEADNQDNHECARYVGPNLSQGMLRQNLDHNHQITFIGQRGNQKKATQNGLIRCVSLNSEEWSENEWALAD